MGDNRLRAKEAPRLFQSRRVRRQTKSVQNRNDATGGLRYWAILNDQGFPDGISAFGFGEFPVFLGRCVRKAEELCLQIVIRQKLVDTPQPDFAKRRRKKV